MKTLAATILLVIAALPASAQEADKPAAAPAQYHLKNKSSFAAPEKARAPLLPIGWVKKEVGSVEVVVTKENFSVDAFRVTSILLGNPALAVINGKSYEEGQFLRMPRGSAALRVRVYRIDDGQVWLQYESKLYPSPLRRLEMNERKPEEQPLLSEDRDVVPMPAPAPAPAPAKPTPTPLLTR